MQRLVGSGWCAVILFAVGCGGGVAPPKLADTVPFEGIVTMDGKPLAGATVMFHPKDAAGFHGAFGTTDESGKYVLESDVGNNKTKKGVIPGKYDVTVSRLVATDGSVLKFDPDVAPMNVGAREQIPMPYSMVNEMGLSHLVGAGGGKFDIEVSSSESSP